MTPEECEARQSIMLNHYVGSVEIEALCMIDMINQHIIPSMKNGDFGPEVIVPLQASVKTLQAALGEVHHAGDEKTRATLARTLRLETMISIREICDAAEAVCPAKLWTLATYKELLFIDQHVE